MSRQMIHLIGLPKNKIISNKLPSLRDLEFYVMICVCKTDSESERSDLLVNECIYIKYNLRKIEEGKIISNGCQPLI